MSSLSTFVKLTNTYKVSDEPESYVIASEPSSFALLALGDYLITQFKIQPERLAIRPCEHYVWCMVYQPERSLNRATVSQLENRCTGFLAGWSAKEGLL
jgi:hypothetical protein